MRKFLLLLLLLATYASAQSTSQVTTFTATGSGSGVNLLRTGVAYYQLVWHGAGTRTTCTIAVDSSIDGVSWSAGNIIAGQSCTTDGAFTVTTPAYYNYMRVTVTALSGAGNTVTAVVMGWINSPVGTSVSLFAGAPSGACTARQFAVNTVNGDFYNCVSAAWNKITGSAGSVRLDQVGNPNTNTALDMGANTANFNFTGNYGASWGYSISSSAGANAAAGYLFEVNAGGSSNKVASFTAGANGVVIDHNGRMVATGGGSIAADTAVALAVNPTNCAPGNYPLGIDASGNVENCTAASAGSGTVTVVSSGSLTSTAFVTGGGTTTLQTPSATSTLDGSGNAVFAGTITGTGVVTTGSASGDSYTCITAPGSPSAGFLNSWCDSTDLRLHDKKSDGTIGTTVVANSCSAGNHVNAVSAAGVVACSADSGGVVITKVSQTAVGADIAPTTILTPGADGLYRASCWIVVTRGATSGATLPNCLLSLTNGDSSTAELFRMTEQAGGNSVGQQGLPSVSAASSIGAVAVVYAKSGVAIQYSTNGYAAGTGGTAPMQYAIRVLLEGPF